MSDLAPAASNIICGKFNSADGSTGTLITVPAGRIWRGWVTLNACASVAASGAAVASHATVQVAGSGTPTPAAGQVLVDVFVAVPAQAAGTTGAVSNRDSQFVTIHADITNDTTLTVTKNSVTSFAATAFGELIV